MRPCPEAANGADDEDDAEEEEGSDEDEDDLELLLDRPLEAFFFRPNWRPELLESEARYGRKSAGSLGRREAFLDEGMEAGPDD